jgi:hypothetical protein
MKRENMKNIKKPYKKPTVTSQKILETAALSCGKCISGSPISQLGCSAKKRTS